jgi:hypothetical protein
MVSVQNAEQPLVILATRTGQEKKKATVPRLVAKTTSPTPKNRLT